MNPIPALVPMPENVEWRDGASRLTPGTTILSRDGAARRAAAWIAPILRASTGFALPVLSSDDAAAGPSIRFTLDPGVSGRHEAYTLVSASDGIEVRAAGPEGLFRGAATLLQLLPPEIETPEPREGFEWTVPAVTISDAPRFHVRGFMLDSCRHIQSVGYIERTLDRLARYKINTFHWHLTEDQGWRIEIRKHPALTEVGAWRGEERYGGFYTQEQIRHIVTYAEDRFITVIPEVDLPGHALSALAAYPELGCTGGPYRVGTEWRIEHDTLCPGEEGTYAFVEDVLREVMELFPSPVIHIGGDEAPRTRWKDCPDCQERIREQGLDGEDALQSYFTRRVADFLRDHGRRLQGWNEIMDGGAPPQDAIVHAWVRENPIEEAIGYGNDVLDSMHPWLYFDYPYTRTPMRKTYGREPVPEGLAPEQQARVLGLQANLWTEYRPTEESCDEFTWPRVLAVAERGWSPEGVRDWDGFRGRLMGDHCRRLSVMGAGTEEELRRRVDITPEDA